MTQSRRSCFSISCTLAIVEQLLGARLIWERSMIFRAMIFISFLMLPFAAAAQQDPQEMNEDEAAVWALEEAYWRYVKNTDIESYLALWDEQFVGWPFGSPEPAEKSSISDWIEPLHADPNRIFKYDLERKAVRSFGDIVVTHLTYRTCFVSRETGEIVEDRGGRKITHTWRRNPGGWQIITGMAGLVAP